MPNDPIKLDQIQKWMQSVITHPEGVAAGVDSGEARQQIPVTPATIESLVTRSQNLSSLERLQIYGHAYYTRLIECLRDEFPATAQAMGREMFDAYAMGYLQSHPSTSYTLAQLGKAFAGFLAEAQPPAPDGNDSEDWPQFVADLAALERIYSEVFDGPGTEGQPPLSPASLQQIPLETWPEIQLVPVPSLRLAVFRFPVHEYITQVRLENSPAVPKPNDTCLAINRREFVVRRAVVDPLPFALLSKLAAGHVLGEAIAQALEDTEADFDELAQALQSWFQEWTAAQFFAAVKLPS